MYIFFFDDHLKVNSYRDIIEVPYINLEDTRIIHSSDPRILRNNVFRVRNLKPWSFILSSVSFPSTMYFVNKSLYFLPRVARVTRKRRSSVNTESGVPRFWL